MKNSLRFAILGLFMTMPWAGDAAGRGFGGYRGGGGFGGYRGGYSSERYGGWGGSHSESRSYSGYSGWNRGGASGSYDRSYTDARGGSISTEGSRGAYYGPRGAAAGGSRETTATGAEGRTYSSSSERGAAVGPYGRAVGGSEGYRTASGPRGTASTGWQSAFASRGFSTDLGLSHYSSFNSAGVAHSTAYWSHGYMNTNAGYVRNNFGYYNCFHPGWYTAHPGCWFAAGWGAGAAWRTATWPAVGSLCGIIAEPADYDYGTTVVYENNNVYDNGQSLGTAQQFAQQAVTLADQGQQAAAPAQSDWTPLGVFALVPADQKTSNNIFQLALNKDGIIRGNYYDGLMDATTEVFGSVNKKTQRAAWTIGKNKDRVFDAGIYNLTQSETPVLVHFGTTKTQQWLLVRVEQPATTQSSP